MALAGDAVPKPTLRRRFVRSFRAAFFQLGLPVIPLAVLPILAAIVRDFLVK